MPGAPGGLKTVVEITPHTLLTLFLFYMKKVTALFLHLVDIILVDVIPVDVIPVDVIPVDVILVDVIPVDAIPLFDFLVSSSSLSIMGNCKSF